MTDFPSLSLVDMERSVCCQICHVTFTRVSAFKKHLNSTEHTQTLSRVYPNDPKSGYKSCCFPHIVFMDQGKIRKPILGLSHMALCFCPGHFDAFYLCHVCESACPLKTIRNHVFSSDHYANYFAYTDPDALHFAWLPSTKYLTTKFTIEAEIKKTGVPVLQLLHLSEELQKQCHGQPYAAVLSLLHQNKELSNSFKACNPGRISLKAYKDDVNREYPLIGLQYLVECICSEPYERRHCVCTLCKTHVSSSAHIKHVLSFEHIHNYFKTWNPSALMTKQCYTDYSIAFKNEILDFTKRSEEIHGTADVQQVMLQPVDFAAVYQASFGDAMTRIESVSMVTRDNFMPSVKPGQQLESSKSSNVSSAVKPPNKPEPSSSVCMNAPSSSNVKPQNKPEPNTTKPTTPFSLYCQNCSRKYETCTLYFNHLSTSRHKELFIKTFGQGNGKLIFPRKENLPLCNVPCVGVSLVVTVLSHQLNDTPFYVCFACEVCIYKPNLLRHVNATRHFIHVLMYLNPWRLPFGWKNRLDYRSLKIQVSEEEEQRGQYQKTIKILDVSAHQFKSTVQLDFPKVMENLNLYHTQIMNYIPRRETFSKLKNNERFPLLGKEFLVKYGQTTTGLKYICLLCERSLSADEYSGHVFCWEHVAAFLESYHPGSLDVKTASKEILLDLAKQAACIHRVSNEQEITLVANFYEVHDYFTKIRLLSAEKAKDGKGPLKPCITPRMKLVPRITEEDTIQTSAKDGEGTDTKCTAMNDMPAPERTAAEAVNDVQNANQGEVSDDQTLESLETCLQEKNQEPKQEVTIQQEADSGPSPLKGVIHNENQTVEPTCLQEKSDDQMQRAAVTQEVDGSVEVSDNENTLNTNNDCKSVNNTALKRPHSILEVGSCTNETEEVNLKQMRLFEPEEKEGIPNNENIDTMGDKTENATVPSPNPEHQKLWMYVRSKIREPLIGLNALYECCCDDQDPVYLCKCCHQILKEEQIIKHLIDPWHYHKYLQSVNAHPLPQGKTLRENTVKLAAYWEQTKGYGDAQVVELGTDDYRKISEGFEWYKALQVVEAHLAMEENAEKTTLDVNDVETVAAKSQNQMIEDLNMKVDPEPQISPDPPTTSEKTEDRSKFDIKTEDTDMFKVLEAIDIQIAKISEASTERVCSPHNIVTNTITINSEVGSETSGMIQGKDTGLGIVGITSLSCNTDARDIPKPLTTKNVPTLARVQPLPPIPTSVITSSTTTSIPASTCTAAVASNTISSTFTFDSSKLKDCTSLLSVSKTKEDAPRSQVFSLAPIVESILPKTQEESNVFLESAAAVSCDNEMPAIKLTTTVPSETRASSVVNSEISAKPTKINHLKLNVDIASNDSKEEDQNVENCQFTPTTPICDPETTKPWQKSTLSPKIGQDNCETKLNEESSITTDAPMTMTMERTPRSTQMPSADCDPETHTTEPSQKTTQSPKIGSDQLIKVSCKEMKSWYFYCFACQVPLEATNHLISTSHQINYVKMKLPWWGATPSESNLSEMVAMLANDETSLRPACRKIEVSPDVYKELKALPGVKAVEKLRTIENHKSSSKTPLQQHPSVTKNEVSRTSPSEATSPVVAGQDKSESEPLEERSVMAVKKMPVSTESAPRPSCKNQKPTSKVAPRVIGATTGDSSHLSRFLKVIGTDESVIGLCSVWECRVMPHKPYKTFYLCESCNKTLSFLEIFEHMSSTKHKWNYMIRQYPKFMYWKDEELLPHMKVELTNSIAGWVAGREESMDAQVVLLSEDYYELVRTAPFVQVLKMVQEIKERKKATITTPQNEVREQPTLESLQAPATDIREQLKRFILQTAEEESDSNDAKQEPSDCLDATSLNSDMQPRTSPKDYNKTLSPNITEQLASQPKKSSSTNPPEPPDMSACSDMVLPLSKLNIPGLIEDDPQPVKNEANASSTIPSSTVEFTSDKDISQDAHNKLNSSSSPIPQPENLVDEDTEKCSLQTSIYPELPACVNSATFKSLKDNGQEDAPVDKETEKYSLQAVSFSTEVSTTSSEGLKDTNHDPSDGTDCELYSPSSPMCQLNSSLGSDVEEETIENMELNPGNEDETIMDMHHVQMLIDLVRETKSLMSLSSQTSTACDVEPQRSADTDATPNDKGLLIEDHSSTADANNTYTANANSSAISVSDNTRDNADFNVCANTRDNANAKLNANTSANFNCKTNDETNTTGGNINANANSNAKINANAKLPCMTTSSEDNLTLSNDAEKPGSANKADVSIEPQSHYIKSVKATDKNIYTTNLPQDEAHSHFRFHPFKVQVQEPVRHLQKDNTKSQNQHLNQVSEKLEVHVAQRLNQLQQSKMKDAQTQNQVEQSQSQTSQTDIIKGLEKEVLTIGAQITPSQTSKQKIPVNSSGAMLPIDSLITSRPHQARQFHYRDCDVRFNQSYNTGFQVNEGVPTTEPTPYPTDTMTVTSGYVQTAYVTNASAGYLNNNDVAQYVPTQASAYSSQVYQHQQQYQQLQAQPQFYTSMQSYGRNVQNQDAHMWYSPNMQLQLRTQPFSSWTNRVVTSVGGAAASNMSYRNVVPLGTQSNQGYTNNHHSIQQYNAVLMQSGFFTQNTPSAPSSMNFTYFPNQQ